jgi:NAD(P)-dependent dehydrogenase (short-subunit alcohol dehydrogenase family)
VLSRNEAELVQVAAGLPAVEVWHNTTHNTQHTTHAFARVWGLTTVCVLGKQGGKHVAIACDVSQNEQVEAAIRQVRRPQHSSRTLQQCCVRVRWCACVVVRVGE